MFIDLFEVGETFRLNEFRNEISKNIASAKKTIDEYMVKMQVWDMIEIKNHIVTIKPIVEREYRKPDST